MVKHLFYTAALLLTGAAAMTACSADETFQSETSKKSVSIKADYASIGLPGTRVASTGDIPSSSLEWSENDAIGVLVDNQNAKFTLSTGTTFTGSVSMEETAAVKGYYPYSSEISGTATSVTLNIPQTQTQSTANVFNGTDQFPMVADASTQAEGLKFKALAGIYRFKIYNTGDDKGDVKSIIVTPATGSKFAGNVTYDYSNTTASYDNASADAVSVTLASPITPATSADADAQCAYMIVADGATLAGSKIVVTTTKGIYDLDLTSASGDKYAVSAGKVRTMLVNLSSANVTAEDVPLITGVSSDMPVEGTTLTVTGTNLGKTVAVKIGGTEYTDFTVNDDGTELTLALPTEIAKTAGGTISLVTTGGLESSSASLLDSDLLIADFAGTYGEKSWGSDFLIDNNGTTNDNAPTSTYFIGLESGTETRKSKSNPWNFGLMLWGKNRMVTTDAISSETNLSDIEIAFEYYMLEDQPTGTNFVLKYPDANSVTVSMPDLTKGAWHTCAVSLDKFAKANDNESTSDAYVDFTSTTYGAFYEILKGKYTDGDYSAALTVDQPNDCETPLNFYMTNVRLRMKSASSVTKTNEVNAELPALSDSDSATTITDFE